MAGRSDVMLQVEYPVSEMLEIRSVSDLRFFFNFGLFDYVQ